MAEHSPDPAEYDDLASRLRSARPRIDAAMRSRHLAAAMAAFDEADSAASAGGESGPSEKGAAAVRPHRIIAWLGAAAAAAVVVLGGIALTSRDVGKDTSTNAVANAATPNPRPTDAARSAGGAADPRSAEKSAAAAPSSLNPPGGVSSTAPSPSSLGDFDNDASLKNAALVSLGSGAGPVPLAPAGPSAKATPSTAARSAGATTDGITTSPGPTSTCPESTSPGTVAVARFAATLRGVNLGVVVFRDAAGNGPFVGVLEPPGCALRRL